MDEILDSNVEIPTTTISDISTTTIEDNSNLLISNYSKFADNTVTLLLFIIIFMGVICGVLVGSLFFKHTK